MIQLKFDFAETVSPGDTLEAEHDGLRVVVTVHADDDAQAPWDREDGHGEVSDWTRRDKEPGERVLCEDRGAKRFYDFAGAVKLARRDGWGVSPYRMDIENGAHGMKRAIGQYFEGRELHTFQSDWCDDVNDAIREVYAAHRATMTPRAYAALAAHADFERLRRWCADQWSYVGVAVTVEKGDVQLTGDYDHALWGIESDCGEYVAEVAAELVSEALDAARAKLAELCDCQA